jgi:hypothetical protein
LSLEMEDLSGNDTHQNGTKVILKFQPDPFPTRYLKANLHQHVN